jgi:hypothetical protein
MILPRPKVFESESVTLTFNRTSDSSSIEQTITTLFANAFQIRMAMALLEAEGIHPVKGMTASSALAAICRRTLFQLSTRRFFVSAS